MLVDGYRPVPGDLICFPRPGVEAANDMPTPKAFRDKLLATTTDFPAHCDIVVRVGRRFVTSIGGNTRNAVTATLTPLDAKGRLTRSNVRPWALALKVEHQLADLIETAQAEGDVRAMNPISASRLVQALFDALTPQLTVSPDEIVEFAMIGLLADPARLAEIRSAADALDIQTTPPSIGI